MEWLQPLSSQWQIAFLVLSVVMGSLLWRGHRETSKLAGIAAKMQEQLIILTRTVEAVEGRTTNTEHTLIANLSEYRMAMGNTSQYREYLQKLGVAPASDVEPILEAIPDGAIAVGKDGRILYVNRALFDASGLVTGMTLDEVAARLDPRTLEGDELSVGELPESKVLKGADVREFLIRMRPEGARQDLILSVNGCPVRDIFGRVVAAVMVGRRVTEEVALAIQVRQLADRETARRNALGQSVVRA